MKVAVELLERTVTVDGTETAASLLVRVTGKPAKGAGEVRVTVQASVAGPATEALVQDKELTEARFLTVPVPVKLMRVWGVVGELLVMVTVPADAPSVVGSNFTFRERVLPAAIVIGRLLFP